jgi:hypothetical protein
MILTSLVIHQLDIVMNEGFRDLLLFVCQKGCQHWHYDTALATTHQELKYNVHGVFGIAHVCSDKLLLAANHDPALCFQ